MSLEKAAQSLVEQLPPVELTENLQERQRRVERLLYILGGTAGAVFLVSIFWTVINEIIIGEVPLLGGLIFLAFILGLVTFALLMLYRQSLLKASSKHPTTPPTLSESEPTGRLLTEAY